MLLTFPATIRLCDLIRELKAGSSRFIQTTLKPDAWFDWQDSYSALSVSPGHRKRIIAYIHCQKQHHADGSLEELLECDSETYELQDDAASEGRSAAGA